MKSFIKNIIYFILILTSLISIISYFGDAGSLFYRKSSYKSISKNLLNNKYVTYHTNINERLLHKEIILNEITIPETIVLGSSRVMQLNTNYFGNGIMFNHGLSGCTIEDIAALLKIYLFKFHKIPKNIILGLDPWILNNNNEQIRYKDIEEYYNSFYSYKTAPLNSYNFKKGIQEYAQLLNPTFFSNSFKNLFNNNLIKISDTFVSNENIILPDGSIEYKNSYNNPTKKQLNKLVYNTLKNPLYSIENFTEINNVKKNELLQLLFFLKNNNCNVKIILSPYHPRVYQYIQNTKKYKNVLISQQIFYTFSNKFNFDIYGSFNPFEIKVYESDFLDAMHMKKIATERLFLNP